MINTTNVIESYHGQLRKVTNPDILDDQEKEVVIGRRRLVHDCDNRRRERLQRNWGYRGVACRRLSNGFLHVVNSTKIKKA